jgi:hypothetical protein
MAKLAVGKDVDSWCTRCKLMLAHTIEAVSGDKITRVHCNTCKTQHAYRPKPPAKAATRKGRSASGSGSRAADNTPQQEFDAMMRGKNPASAKRYVLADRFSSGDVIKHPQFGLGVVRNVKDHDKIEVVFTDAQRTLVHGHRV